MYGMLIALRAQPSRQRRRPWCERQSPVSEQASYGFAIRLPAHDARAIAHDQHIIALEPRLHLADVRAIDDRRSMHAQKASRVEAALQVGDRFTYEERLRAEVQTSVFAHRFDPLDLGRI